jgi:hypothetical protein
LVGDERLDFFGGGREANEVEGSAADEGNFIGWGRGLEAFLCQFGEDEGVDGVLRRLWNGWFYNGLEGPPAFLGFGKRLVSRGGRSGSVEAGKDYESETYKTRREWSHWPSRTGEFFTNISVSQG